MKIQSIPIVDNDVLVEEFGEWKYFIDFELSRNYAVVFFHLLINVVGEAMLK